MKLMSLPIRRLMSRSWTLPAALIAALCSMALLAAPAGAACPNENVTLSAATQQQAEQAVFCLVNVERMTRGLGPLFHSPQLEASARGHSTDMATKNYFDHVGRDGSNSATRAQRAGYDWQMVGENIAAGQMTAKAVMLGWMQSDGHCRNILNSGYRDIGIGSALTSRQLYPSYWTQNFGLHITADEPAANQGPRNGCPYRTLYSGPLPVGMPNFGDVGGGTGNNAPADSGSPGSTKSACGKVKPKSLRIVKLKRMRGGKLRVQVRIVSSVRGCSPRVNVRVKRGKKTTNKRFTLKQGTRWVTVRAPRTRGKKAKVTVRGLYSGRSVSRSVRV